MLHPLRILLVEDNPRDTELLIETLRQAKFEPDWRRVETRADFLSNLHPGIDIILSDYSMPQFNGIAALELLKESGLDIPFIIVSGTIGEEVAVKAMKLGATDYLLKDRLARLGPAVSQALEQNRIRKERQLALEARHATGKMLQTIFDSAPVAIEELDLEGRVIRWNAGAYRMFGWTEDEVVGRVCATVPADEVAEYVAMIDRVVRDGGQTGLVYRRKKKNGELIYASIVAAALRSSSGQTVGVMVIVEDITERKRAEEELRLREARLLQAERVGRVGSWTMDLVDVLDLEGNPAWWSDGFFRLLGYESTEVEPNLGNFFRRVHPDDRDRVRAAVDETVRTGAKYSVEHRVVLPNGAECIIHEQGDLICEPQTGRPLQIVGMSQDVTEQRKADLAIRTSEERFRHLIENASDVIGVVDEAGIIQYQSPSTPRVLGYTLEEMTGHRITEFINPEDHAKVTEALERVLAGQGGSSPIEFRIAHRDGTWRVFQALGKSMIEADGTKLIVFNSRDITDSRRLEEQLRQSQKMEAIGQLSSGVAHDFNNLLTVIKGYLDLLRIKGQISPEMANAVEQINEAADRASNLTRQLLMFSRQEVMQPADYNLNGLVANLVKMLRRLLAENIEMRIECAVEPLMIRADEGMVEQVLLNLVVNARDAMPKGGSLVISTGAVEFDEVSANDFVDAKPGKFVCFEIADSGAGIAREILPRIFEPFFTTKGAGKGTGLGLAMVYGIMRQHNGWISVESEVDRGTTFRAYFPRLELTETTSIARSATASVRGGHEGILLVEDEMAVRQIAEAALASLGYRVYSAPTGRAALQVWELHKQSVDLLLTDLVMPGGVTGRRLAVQLREENPQLSIVYMSGYSNEAAGDDFQLQEGVNYLSKPFDLSSLAKIVRTSLDRGATNAPFPVSQGR